MEESCEHSSSFIFDLINLILADNVDMHNGLNESNFGQIVPPPTPELSALARLKNCCEHSRTYIFDWIFFSFFQVTRTTNKSGQSSNFGQMGPRDTKL